MTKPIQAQIESILRRLDSLRALTLNFEWDGKSFNLDRDETVKVVASGVYRYLWSKYQATQRKDELKLMADMRAELERRGISLDEIRTT